MARKAVGKLLIAAVLAGLVVLGPGVADAGVPVKTGKYKGKTTQEAVNSAFRTIQFTVKKGKVILTTEPSVGFQSCVSTPVFTLGGTTVSKKLGRNRAFTFAQTFFGNKIEHESVSGSVDAIRDDVRRNDPILAVGGHGNVWVSPGGRPPTSLFPT